MCFLFYFEEMRWARWLGKRASSNLYLAPNIDYFDSLPPVNRNLTLALILFTFYFLLYPLAVFPRNLKSCLRKYNLAIPTSEDVTL